MSCSKRLLPCAEIHVVLGAKTVAARKMLLRTVGKQMRLDVMAQIRHGVRVPMPQADCNDAHGVLACGKAQIATEMSTLHDDRRKSTRVRVCPRNASDLIVRRC